MCGSQWIPSGKSKVEDVDYWLNSFCELNLGHARKNDLMRSVAGSECSNIIVSK